MSSPSRIEREAGVQTTADSAVGEPATRAAIAVVGMHRSGTSAVARVLSLLGADLPQNLMPAWESNEQGHWEPERIVALNEQLLADAATAWDDVSRFPDAWYGSTSAEEYRGRLVELLAKEYGDSRLFVLKDPRLSRLIPFWLRAVSEFGADPSFVITVRNPLEVAASLKARDGFSFPKGLLLWLRHTIDAERDTRGHPRAFLSYELLLSDWEREARSVSQQLGVSWPRLNHRARVEIEQFLSTQHRHYSATTRELQAHAAAVAWVGRVYEALERACAEGEAPSSETLDEVGWVLDEADAAYGPLLAEAGLLHEGDERELDQRRLEIEKRGEALEHLRGELANQGADVERLQGELGNQGADVERLRASLEGRESEVESLNAQLAKHEQDLAAVRTELEARSSEAEQHQTARGELQQQLEDADSDRARQRDQIAKLESVHERLRGELDQVREEAADAEARQADLFAELRRREQEVGELREVISRRKGKVEQLTQKLDRREAALVEAVAARTEAVHEGDRLRAELTHRVRAQDQLAADLRVQVGLEKELRSHIDKVEADHERHRKALDSVRMETARAFLDMRPASKWTGLAKLLSWVLPLPRAQGRRYFRTFFALRRSESFDYGYYLARCPDVTRNGQNALMHYIEPGAAEGRNPSPEFNTNRYVAEHPELADSGENPLLHFVRTRDREAGPVKQP